MAQESREELGRFVNEHGVNVNFPGNVPKHEFPEILSQTELFILPSLWESTPKILLEAIACGLPVTGTNVDGIKEVMKHGENGILCDTDCKSIREAIISVIGDKELRERLGVKAGKTIEERFPLERLVEKELGLYLQLLM